MQPKLLEGPSPPGRVRLWEVPAGLCQLPGLCLPTWRAGPRVCSAFLRRLLQTRSPVFGEGVVCAREVRCLPASGELRTAAFGRPAGEAWLLTYSGVETGETRLL